MRLMLRTKIVEVKERWRKAMLAVESNDGTQCWSQKEVAVGVGGERQ